MLPFYDHSFVNSHVNGGIAFDSCFAVSSVGTLFSEAFVHEEVELSPGAPSLGPWPICYEWNVNKPLKCFEVRHDVTRENWDYLSSGLEVDVKKSFDVSIT